MRFFISNNPSNLAAFLSQFASTATVEAEYGDVTVYGSTVTMAHHGKNAGGQCPCSYENFVDLGVEAVGLSHVDLDTLGGCMALLGTKPDAPSFWQLAEFVDLNGAHRLGESRASSVDLARLYAWWAYSETVRLFPPRDGSVEEVTDKLKCLFEAVANVCADNQEMLDTGEKFRLAGEALNAASFVQDVNGVLVRVSDRFVNHLYCAPGSHDAAEAVVAFNTLTGAITVSFADGGKKVSARLVVQGLWGELAGGHDGIAGSPRGQRMALLDLYKTAETVFGDLQN